MANPALFFGGAPEGFALYAELERRILAAHPQVTVKVQKTQITFSDPRGYLFASRPRRRGGGLMVTFGLSVPLESPRLFAVANPAPGRYTHHVQVRDSSELDDELMRWIAWSHDDMAARQRRERK